jgi:single-stranded DNA-binding protein
MAESVINNAKKGTKVNLTGRLSMDTYTDKAGVERSTPQVTVDSIGAYPYKTKDSITTAVDPWGENQSPF